MKKIGLIAAAATLAAAGAAFGQGTIDLRIVGSNASGADASITGADLSTVNPDAPFQMTLYVQAFITGDATATGISALEGYLNASVPGTFSPGVITAIEVGVPVPGAPDFSGRLGLLPAFRGGLSDDLSDPLNPMPDNDGDANGNLRAAGWQFLPLALTQTGAGGVTGYSSLYKFTFTSEGNAGTLPSFTIDVSSPGAGYQNSAGLVNGDIVNGASFAVVPAPGAFALMGLGGLVAIRRRR